MKALVVQRGHGVANDLVREFAHRFPHQIVGFRQFGAGKVACDLRSRLGREVENDSSFNVASEFDHRGNTLAAISHRLHGEVSNRHGGFQALRQHGIGRVDERLDQLHLHN